MMGVVVPHMWKKVRLGSSDLGSQPEVATRAAGPALLSGEPAPSLDHCKARHASTIPSPNMKTDPLSDPCKHTPPVWDKGRMPSLKEGNNSGITLSLAFALEYPCRSSKMGACPFAQSGQASDLHPGAAQLL